MFVYSVKGSSLKFFGALALSVCVLLAIILLIPVYEPVSASAAQTVNFENIKTEEDRIAFLNSFGWTVAETPVEEVKVTIPSEFDRVFMEYNNIQKMQGLDLSKYKRKSVMRYTYEITNYEGYDGTVYANVLVFRNKVIGGDICSADPNGFVATFYNEK